MHSFTTPATDNMTMAWPDLTRLPRAVLALLISVAWRALLLDLIFVTIWVVAVSVVFRIANWPTWLYYIVVFGSVLSYSLMNGRWTLRRLPDE